MFDRRVGSLAPRRGQAALLCVLLLAGCGTVQRLNDSKLTLETPIDWWHDLQGGRIARDRPPPPGATDPYPNLSSVPARPTPTDVITRRALTEQLAAERDRTQRAATRDPIVAAGAPAAVAAAKAAAAPKAAPAATATGPAPAGAVPAGTAPAGTAPIGAPPAGVAPVGAASVAALDDEPSKAVLDAATAPPAPAARRNARTDPAASPGAAPPASGPLPDLPTGAPPIPQLPGLPATTFAPAAPPPLPQAVIAFARGSAELPDSADPALRALAARLAGGGMVVQAGGDADGAGPDRQAAALPLGLARARAIQRALVAAGVPLAAIRIEAAGLGRTGSARLLP